MTSSVQDGSARVYLSGDVSSIFKQAACLRLYCEVLEVIDAMLTCFIHIYAEFFPGAPFW